MLLYFSRNLEILVALKGMFDEAKPLELKVNWAETIGRSFEGLLDDTVQSVHKYGDDVEVTKSFT